MSQRKPPDLSWESFAQEQIRQAQSEGQFDNLPGFGQPIPDIDEPFDELWWIKAKMRREKLSLLPPGLQIRVDVERDLQRIWALPTESAVRREVAALNDRIRQANFAAAWGPPSTTMPLDVEEVLERWRQYQASHTDDSVHRG